MRRKKIILVASALLLIMLVAGCKPNSSSSSEESARSEREAAAMERQVEQERARATGLEQDVKSLQDDLSVSHAIAYACAAAAACFIALLMRERRGRRAVEKLLRFLEGKSSET